MSDPAPAERQDRDQVTLPSGSIVALHAQHFQPREATVKIVSGGKSQKAIQDCPGAKITIKYEDGKELVGHSACKPPDQYCRQEGMRKALYHLMNGDTEKRLTKADRAFLYQRLTPKLAGKPNLKKKKYKKLAGAAEANIGATVPNI